MDSWTLTGTTWPGIFDPRGGRERRWTWRELADWLATPPERLSCAPEAPKLELDEAKKRLTAWSAATFVDGYRCGPGVQDAGAVLLDLDSSPELPETKPERGAPELDRAALVAVLGAALGDGADKVAWLAHTSPRAHPGAWRWRVVVPLSRRVAGDEWREVCGFLRCALLVAADCPAAEADLRWCEAPRGYFAPCRTPHYQHAEGAGAPLDVDRLLAVPNWRADADAERAERWPPPPKPPPAQPSVPRPPRPAEDPRADAYLRAAEEGILGELRGATPGGRNVALNRAAFELGQLVELGCSPGWAEDELLSVARELGLGEGEARGTIRSGLDAGQREPRELPPDTRHRENGPMADDTTTTEEEAPADLDRWTVAEAVRLLVARAHPARGRPVGFPWPGAPETWPLGGDGTTDIKPDAALPPADGVCRPNWRPLWSLVGPLSPDRVAVLVGPTGRGKTAFAVQVAEAAAAAGHPVVYLSVELGAEELAARLIALRARGAVPWRAVLRGQVPRPELEQAGTDLVARCPNLYLCAPPPGQRTAARLARLARAVAARHDGRPPLVVVDYLQRMKGDESDRRWEVSALSGELRALSRPCDDFPGAGVLALSSTARTNYSGGKKSSLRGFWPLWRAASEDPDSLVGLGKETGEIEYDASLVLVLTCDPKMEDNDDDDDDDDRGAEDKETTGREDTHRRGALAAAKVREGETGTVRLDFDGARGWWGDAKRLGRWKPKPPKDDTGEERTGRAPRKTKPQAAYEPPEPVP